MGADDAIESRDPKKNEATKDRPSSTKRLGTWAFLLIPAVGLVELGLHFVQVKTAVTHADWERARDAVAAIAKPDDLITFAPRWTDPVGRQVFGPLATFEREGFGDVTRFPRAIEVSVRGKHSLALEGWRETANTTADRITVRTLENPAYKPTLTDLVSQLNPTSAEASIVTREGGAGQPCSWEQGTAQTGNLGFGPAVPANRFVCSHTFVGVSVIADLDYYARRCIYAPPPGAGASVRVLFRGVKFGEVLHGHHGLYVEAERGKTGTPVFLSFVVDGHHIGKVTHADGEGWKGFDLPTGDLNGKSADLIAEISSSGSNRRQYCFEAITR